MPKPSEEQIRDLSWMEKEEPEEEGIYNMIEETFEIPLALDFWREQLEREKKSRKEEFERSSLWRDVQSQLPKVLKELQAASAGNRKSWNGIIVDEQVVSYIAGALKRHGFKVTLRKLGEPEWELMVVWE